MTMEMEGGIKTYLRDIAKTPLLTREEEFELAERIKNGDKAAREHMIRANLRLVVKIAQDYANYGLPLLDLISEGNMGLMKSVERFDPNKGGKLSTYAAWWIKQSIKRALANQSKTIRLPVHMVDKISKMRRVAMTMSEELGREPTDEELAEEIGIDRAKIAHLKSAAVRPMSLDAPVSDDDTTEFGEIIGDEKAQSPLEILSRKNMHMQLDDLLEVLDERERKIIDARFGLAGQKPKTLEEVGKEFGVTRERIRQLENIALKKARKKLKKREEEQPEAYAGPDFLGHQDEVFQPRSIIAPSKKRQIAPVKRGGPVRVRQPLGGRNRDKFVETPSVKRDIQRELLEVKKRNMPSLEERESLESTQQQVIDLWFGFDGTRFVVESGLNFREIGERLYITADEARTFYEDAMVFLERNRAHLSLPRTVDEYEHAVEDAGCAEVLEREIDTHRVLGDEGNRELGDEKPVPWWKRDNFTKIEPPKHPSVIQVGSPKTPGISQVCSRPINGDRVATILSGATPPVGDLSSEKSKNQKNGRGDARSERTKKIQEEAPHVRLIFDRLTPLEKQVAELFWGDSGDSALLDPKEIAYKLQKTHSHIGVIISGIRKKVRELSQGVLQNQSVFIRGDTSGVENGSLEIPETADTSEPIENLQSVTPVDESVSPIEPEISCETDRNTHTKLEGREGEAKKVREIWDSLTPKEQKIAELFWGKEIGNLTHNAPRIVKILGVSRQNVYLHLTNIRDKVRLGGKGESEKRGGRGRMLSDEMEGQAQCVQDVWDKLTPKEQQIAELFWGIGEGKSPQNTSIIAEKLQMNRDMVYFYIKKIRDRLQGNTEREIPQNSSHPINGTNEKTKERVAAVISESQKHTERSGAVSDKEHAIEQKIRELLTEREYRIIEAGFGLNGVSQKTPDELGREFDCTAENIRLIQNRALAKIASFFGIPFSSLETLLQSTPSLQSQGHITDKTEMPESKESLPAIEQENQISEERKAEAEKVRAILHTMSGTELAVAKRFWGEKEGDPMSSPAEIVKDLQMKSSGNVNYYITKIRTRLSRGSSSATQNNGTRSVLVSSTLATKHKQDPLIIALYDPTNISKLAEDLDMTEEELLARAQMLGMDILCAHISTLESGKGAWLINKDFAHTYDISIEWLRHGKRASDLVHEEARIIGIDGSKHFDVLIRDTKYYSPHLQALLLREYKKQHPSYRIPQDILEQFKK